MDFGRNDPPHKNVTKEIEDINLDGIDAEVFADKVKNLYRAITEMYTTIVESFSMSSENSTNPYHALMELKLNRHLTEGRKIANDLMSSYRRASFILKEIIEEHKKKINVSDIAEDIIEDSFVMVDSNSASTSAEIVGTVIPSQDVTNKPDYFRLLDRVLRDIKNLCPYFVTVSMNKRCTAQECSSLCDCVFSRLNQKQKEQKGKKK